MDVREILADPTVPICLDTNVVWGVAEPSRRMALIFDRHPGRRVILPAAALMERVRQECDHQEKHGREFNPSFYRAFIEKWSLEIIALTQEAILTHGSDALHGATFSKPWAWEDLHVKAGDALPWDLPCARRCRFADHEVHLVARSLGAILVSDDAELRGEVLSAGWTPGACGWSDVETFYASLR